MSQIPPSPGYSDPAGYPPLPGPYPPQPQAAPRNSAWKWIVGILGMMVFMPCLCCGGCLADSFTVKDLTISNGEHLGGSPLNVKVNYMFHVDEHHGLTKNYHMVVRAANGIRRERTVVGGGFAFQRIPVHGTWQFGNAVDLGPDQNKNYVQVWIESEDDRGSRSIASNTLTIYPKS
jgi:hypothetical protein